MAGGWVQAARLPAEEALAWAEDHLKDRSWRAYKDSLQVWASTLPAFRGASEIPEAPDPPEEE